MTRAVKNLHFNRLLLTKVYNVRGKESIEELFLMARNIDGKYEGKLTWAFKNVTNLANFHQSMFRSLKIGTLRGPFIQSRKCMSLKFTEEFCVMTIKNDGKFEEKLTCQFKIDMRNLTNVDPSTQKSQKFSI